MCREPADAGLELVVQLIVERTDVVPDLGVAFNGGYPVYGGRETEKLIFPAGNFTHHLPEYRAFEYRFQVSEIIEGWNNVQVYNGTRKFATAAERRDHTVRLVGFDLGVVKSTHP
jgi:hypothetical protein